MSDADVTPPPAAVGAAESGVDPAESNGGEVVQENQGAATTPAYQIDDGGGQVMNAQEHDAFQDLQTQPTTEETATEYTEGQEYLERQQQDSSVAEGSQLDEGVAPVSEEEPQQQQQQQQQPARQPPLPPEDFHEAVKIAGFSSSSSKYVVSEDPKDTQNLDVDEPQSTTGSKYSVTHNIDQDKSAEEPSTDWVAYVDKTSGSPYFYNTQTGESSWTEPLNQDYTWTDHDEDGIAAERMAAGREMKKGPKPASRADTSFERGGWGADTLRRRGVTKKDENMENVPDFEEEEFLLERKKSAISSVADDGLGVNFLDTAWEEPSVEKAEIYQHMHMFEAGRQSACRVERHDFGHASIGVRAMFELLHALGLILTGAFVLSIPAIILYSSGTGSENVWDVTSLSSLTAANAGLNPATINASLSTMGINAQDPKEVALAIQEIEVPFGNTVATAKTVTDTVSAFDLVTSLFLLCSLWYVRHKLNGVAAEVHLETASAASYTIKVTSGLPPDVTIEELIKHFDRLYRLDKPDHKGRPEVYCLSNHNSYKTETLEDGTVLSIARPVVDVSHNGDDRFLGSWLADVVLIRDEGDVIRHYQHLEGLDTKVRHTRAMVKRVSPGSRYRGSKTSSRERVGSEGDGVDIVEAEKLTKKLMGLEFQQQQGLHQFIDKGPEAAPVVGAFITFNHEMSYLRALDDYSVAWRRYLLCGYCCPGYRELRFRYKHVLQVTAAPEPSDVLYENQGEYKHRVKHGLRTCISVLTVGGVLLLSLIAIFTINVIKSVQLGGATTATGGGTERICSVEIPQALAVDSTSMSHISKDTFFYFRRASQGSSTGFSADGRCQYKTGDSSAVWITANTQKGNGEGGVKELFSDRYNVSYCSTEVHGCTPHPSLKIQNGTSSSGSQGLCPCVIPTSSRKCPHLPSKDSALVDSDIAVCYCIQRINQLSKKLGSPVAAISELIKSDAATCQAWLNKELVAGGWSFASSATIAIVNIILGWVIGATAVKMRPSTLTGKTSEIFVTLTLAQLFNALIITILINAKFDAGLFSGIGEHRDISQAWFTSAGSAITSTMLILSASSHIQPAVDACCFFRSRKHARSNPHTFVSQGELNAQFVGKKYTLEYRLAYTAIPVITSILFGTFMPMLYLIALITVLLTYWVDKCLIVKYHSRPPAVSAAIPILATDALLISAVIRLAISTWIFGIDTLFVSSAVSSYNVVSDDASGDSTSLFAKAQTRVQKSASLPHFLVLVAIIACFVVYHVLKATFKQFLSSILFLVCPRDCCGHNPERYLQTKKKRISVSGNSLSTSGEYGKTAVNDARATKGSNLSAEMKEKPDPIIGRLPPFTEPFATMVKPTFRRQNPRGSKRGGSTADGGSSKSLKPITHKIVSKKMRARGWDHTCCRSDFSRPCEDPYCNEVHQRTRKWMSDGEVQGVRHQKGEFCRTWEVIRLNQHYSYRIELNEDYSHVLHLRQEGMLNNLDDADNVDAVTNQTITQKV